MSQLLDCGAQAVARGAARCALWVLGRVAQAVARGAAQVIFRGSQYVAHGAARCAPAVARGAARCASQVMNTASKLGPHTQTDRGTCPGVGSEFTSKAAKRLALIQTQVAQRRMQRVEVYARALRLSQHVK